MKKAFAVIPATLATVLFFSTPVLAIRSGFGYAHDRLPCTETGEMHTATDVTRLGPDAHSQQVARPFTARVEPTELRRGETTTLRVVGRDLPEIQRVIISPPFGVTIVEIKPAAARADGLQEVAIVVQVDGSAGMGERPVYAVTPGWEFELTKVRITAAGTPGTAAGDPASGGAHTTGAGPPSPPPTGGSPRPLSTSDADDAIVRYCATLPDGVAGTFKDACFRKDANGYPGELVAQSIEAASAKYYQVRDAGDVNGARAWFGGSVGPVTIVWSRGGRFFLAYGSGSGQEASGEADRTAREQAVALGHARRLDAMLPR